MITRRKLFQRVAAAFAGCVLARMPLAGKAATALSDDPVEDLICPTEFSDKPVPIQITKQRYMPKCEVCGDPASVWWTDAIEVASDGSDYRRYFAGTTHAMCVPCSPPIGIKMPCFEVRST